MLRLCEQWFGCASIANRILFRFTLVVFQGVLCETPLAIVTYNTTVPREGATKKHLSRDFNEAMELTSNLMMQIRILQDYIGVVAQRFPAFYKLILLAEARCRGIHVLVRPDLCALLLQCADLLISFDST